MSRLRRPSPPCCRHTAGRISSVCRTPVRGTPVVSASSCPRVQTGVCLSVLKHTDFHQRSMCVFFCPTIFLMMIYFGIRFVMCAVRVLLLPPLFVHAFSTAFVAVCEQSVFLVTCDHSCRSVVSVCKKTKQNKKDKYLWQTSSLLWCWNCDKCPVLFSSSGSLWLTGATVGHGTFTALVMTKSCISTVATRSQKTTNPQEKKQTNLHC